MTVIHPTALVSTKAQLASDVSVGPFTMIHDDVILEEGCVIEGHCEIGRPTPMADGLPLVVGKQSLIRSHSIFYQGSSFGDGLVAGHRVTVREKTVAGSGFQIGTLSDIQGHCEIGQYVRTHSNVHIGQKSKIRDFVWLFPYVVLTNDPHPPSNVCVGCEIDDYAVIATMSVILPGVKIGKGALVAAHSSVGKEVLPHTVVGGSPAKFLCETSKIKLRNGSGQSAYPWPKHFTRGYPDAVIQQWLAEYGNHNT
jgi:acyl-[acyl carrier protein]--UDP-N-acetylglucosamine O-acyltransferase